MRQTHAKNAFITVIVITALIITAWHSVAIPLSASQSTIRLKKSNLSLLTSNKVLILVDDSIYNQLKSEITRFSNDIVNAGFSCETYHRSVDSTWNSPQQVKQFISAHSSNLAGCVFVGHIPMAKYRVKGYRNKIETFPCDFYYMDLDGKWDVYEEGGWYREYHYTVFCNHTGGNGDVKPEIWVGRISPDKWIGDKVELLREYFDRNHAYRTGQMKRGKQALLYIDDDWADDAAEYKGYLRKIYPSACIRVVNDEETTRENDYMNRLADERFEWVRLHAHSGALMHKFYYRNHHSWDSLSCWELRNNYTGGLFYDLHSCEALDYSIHCIGNLYVFGETSGLLVVGSSKVGGFNDDGKHLYGRLSTGVCIGNAFKLWYAQRGVDWPEYCYGMQVLGDPTLHLQEDSWAPTVDILSPQAGYLYLNGRELMPLVGDSTVVIGAIKVSVDVHDLSAVDHVEFYVDDELVSSMDSAPYVLDLDEFGWGRKTVEVVGYDVFGNNEHEQLDLFIVNLQ